ncbi:MAG: translesion error-prone DNA polymerase V autoproteolytic subunit [Bacteroidales bacterium]|jgi:DNA polymerase V|nr:translesion error-prone DNA polymerase V autoproteolytic subunit [Bacteroidales bacterium]
MGAKKNEVQTGQGGVFLPLADGGIKAGFASPAQDYVENGIDLNRELVKNPASTFYGRVSGSSMIGAGIEDGDILVIDKSLQARDGDIAVCFVDGEFTLKRVKLDGEVIWLVPENPNYKPIKITKENDFAIWGVVTYTIKDIRRKNSEKKPVGRRIKAQQVKK